MNEPEIAVLNALKDGAWRDRNYLKAKQAADNGYEYRDYTSLMRSLKARGFVAVRETLRQPGGCWYEYQITEAGLRAIGSSRL